MAEIFDLIVIGGGLNGVGVARDAAGRGLSVALFEKDDLAEHSSSASSKIIDGGMRDLQDRHIWTVRNALIERERLMRIAPHIIWPIEFWMPHASSRRSGWKIRLDLSLYDRLARREFLARSRRVRLKRCESLQSKFKTAFSYSDCWVEDSRLVVLNAMDAAARGAQVFTRTKVLSARADGDIWNVETQAGHFKARTLVNAAGALVQDVLTGRLGLDTDLNLRLLKQSHIITKRLYSEKNAFMLRNPDRKLIFMIPYEQDYTLIGASESRFDGDPLDVQTDDSEIEYLCTSVNRYFRIPLKSEDVLWTFSSISPVFADRRAAEGSLRRGGGLAFLQGQAPCISIFGGKMTTYRQLAEQALGQLLPAIGLKPAKSWTANAYLPGGDIQNFPEFKRMLRVRNSHLDVVNLHRLAYSYGSMTEKFVSHDMGQDFGAGLYQAEIDYLLKHEWARTAEDILWRRTKLGLHAPEDTVQRVAAYLKKETSPFTRRSHT